MYSVLNKLRIFYESINKKQRRLGRNLTTVAEKKKRDVLGQIKDENVTISLKIHKLLSGSYFFPYNSN